MPPLIRIQTHVWTSPTLPSYSDGSYGAIAEHRTMIYQTFELDELLATKGNLKEFWVKMLSPPRVPDFYYENSDHVYQSFWNLVDNQVYGVGTFGHYDDQYDSLEEAQLDPNCLTQVWVDILPQPTTESCLQLRNDLWWKQIQIEDDAENSLTLYTLQYTATLDQWHDNFWVSYNQTVKEETGLDSDNDIICEVVGKGFWRVKDFTEEVYQQTQLDRPAIAWFRELGRSFESGRVLEDINSAIRLVGPRKYGSILNWKQEDVRELLQKL